MSDKTKLRIIPGEPTAAQVGSLIEAIGGKKPTQAQLDDFDRRAVARAERRAALKAAKAADPPRE